MGKAAGKPEHVNERMEEKPSSKPQTRKGIMRRRHLRLKEVCSEFHPNTTYDSFCGHVHVSDPLDLSWCYVPKAGCTFWKKVFYYVQEKTRHKMRGLNMVDIGFRQIHTVHIKNLCQFRTFSEMAYHMSMKRTLLVVRDPYSRLFSAYIDKFYLPDHWKSVGIYLINTFRQNASVKSKRCGHDVTFEEFVDYVIYIGKTHTEHAWFCDDHWHPISHICLPCAIDYKYIAKQESFVEDREFLVEELGIDRYFNTSLSREKEVVTTLTQTIEAYWRSGLRDGCLSKLELINRMWTAFKIQGYLPYNKTIPYWEFQRGPNGITMERFKYVVLETYSQHKGKYLKDNRRKALIKSYDEISLKQMRELQNIYRLDFEMFNYEKEPTDLYAQFKIDISI